MKNFSINLHNPSKTVMIVSLRQDFNNQKSGMSLISYSFIFIKKKPKPDLQCQF